MFEQEPWKNCVLKPLATMLERHLTGIKAAGELLKHS